jgi:hypothetical protein
VKLLQQFFKTIAEEGLVYEDRDMENNILLKKVNPFLPVILTILNRLG